MRQNGNIFHRIAFQGLVKSRTRTIVTIIGVILSAAMITAVASFGVSLLDYMVRGAEEKYGGWHVGFSDVDSSFIQERAADKGTSDTAVFQNIGYARLEGSKNPDKPYLFIAGFEDDAFEMLKITLISGRMPENSSELVVSASIAANAGVEIKAGDALTLAAGIRIMGEQALNQHDAYSGEQEQLLPGKERTYTVVGICQRPGFEEISSPGYTVITRADEGDGAERYSMFAALENPWKVKDYAKTMSQGNPYIYNDHVLRFMGISDDKIFNMLLYAVGGIVILIIMTGSVFLIYNAFHISLTERTRQLGILLSVGATERQLRNSVLFEGLCIGAAGIPAGVILGLLGIDVVIEAVSRSFGNIMYDGVPLELKLSVPVIGAAALIALITILISAYLPARKAAKTPVMECIRQTNEIKVEARKVKISGFAIRMYGLEGVLAIKNFKRNKKRCRSIVLSLVLSVVLFISTNEFVICLRQASKTATVFTTYDIGVAAADMEDEHMLELYDSLKHAEGVTDSSYQEVIRYYTKIKRKDASAALREAVDDAQGDEYISLAVKIQSLDHLTYLKKIQEAGLSPKEYSAEKGNLIAIAKVEESSRETGEKGDFVDMFTDTALDMKFSQDAESFGHNSWKSKVTFVDIVGEDTLPVLEASENTPYFFTVMAPWPVKESLVGTDVQADSKGLTFCSENAARSEAAMKEIILAVGAGSRCTLYNTKKMLEQNSNMIFIANVFAYTFIVLISLIAAANVFNTISTNIKLRRRELAMLRSVGMSDRAFQKMMNFECIFYGVRALSFGLPVSFIFCVVIYQWMKAAGAEDVKFMLPWASIGISICSVLIIVFITMLYSISKIKKENIIDALRDDLA